tara:strand:+ start:3534 stop:3713 length:180 start_codon:yes stop_codon:yes gene_type:complete
MPENNNKNCHALTNRIVKAMDTGDLMNFVHEKLLSHYEENTEAFLLDWNNYDMEEMEDE